MKVIALVVMMILAAEANMTTEKTAGKKVKTSIGRRVDEGKGKGKAFKEEREEVNKVKDVMDDAGVMGHLLHHDCGADHPHNDSQHFEAYEFARIEDMGEIYSETLRMLREDEKKWKEVEGQSSREGTEQLGEIGPDKSEQQSNGQESNAAEDKEKYEDSELADENNEASTGNESELFEAKDSLENRNIFHENELQEPILGTYQDSSLENQEESEDLQKNNELRENSKIGTDHQDDDSDSRPSTNDTIKEPQIVQEYIHDPNESDYIETQVPIPSSTPDSFRNDSPKMFYDSVLPRLISFAENLESLFIRLYKEIRSHDTYKLTAFYSALLLVIYLFYPSPPSTTFKVTISNDNSGIERLEKIIDDEYGKIKKLFDQKQGEPKKESSESLMLKKIFEDLENIKELEANFQVQVIDAHQEIWKAIDKRSTPLSPPRTIKILLPEE